MKKALALLFCGMLVLSSCAQQEDEYYPVFGEQTLYLRTEYSANKASEPLIGIVQEKIDKSITSLGKIELVDLGFRYIVKIYIDMTEISGMGSFVELKATIIDPAVSKDHVVYEVSKTGSVSELSRLCESLVKRMDMYFLNTKYFKEPEEAREDDVVDKLMAKKVAPVEDVSIDPDEAMKKAVIQALMTPDTEPAAGITPDKMTDQQKTELMKKAGMGGRKLTQAEMEFATRHSDKAPRIAQITMYAQSESRRAKSVDPALPEDAYRHVLWSYLLTKEFGASFAKKVTDTHEIGPTGNTPAERRMDYANNAVGRRYATSGVSQAQLIQKVKTDPSVVKEP